MLGFLRRGELKILELCSQLSRLLMQVHAGVPLAGREGALAEGEWRDWSGA